MRFPLRVEGGKTLYFFIFQEKEEERAEEERRARFSRKPAGEDFGGHEYRTALNF